MANLNRLIELHNKHRAKGTWMSGPRQKLQEDKQLSRYAQKWAEHMASENKMFHSSMRSIMDLGFSNAGENVAYGSQGELEVFQQWMRSYGHKRNIMNKSFTHIGCGVATSKEGTPYWCVCFGKR